MEWTLVSEINEMDYGFKEMNEMDYGLKELRWNVTREQIRMSD